MRHYDARDSRHLLIPGKCRYRTADATRSYAPRTGRHPRPPAIPASGDPTAGMSGTKDGKELGHEAEEENLQRLREAERLEDEDKPNTSSPSSSSSSSSPVPEPAETRSTKSKPSRGQKPSEPAKLWDRPDMNEPQQPPNWSSFDIGKTLRSLKVSTEAQARFTFRKLHLRWWHAPAATMIRILKEAGISDSLCKIIPGVVATCAACRAWAKTPPQSVASASIAEYFNYQVECDLIFHIPLCYISPY